MSREAMKLALEALETSMYPQQKQLQAITALREALAEQPAQQEPVALKWQQAPVKTQWGDDMVVASVAIDNDHTLSLYCERDQVMRTSISLLMTHKRVADLMILPEPSKPNSRRRTHEPSPLHASR